jgi:gamma-glutamyltranspeptidase/glutathione hydrolase
MPLNAKAVYARSNADYVPFPSRRSTVHSTKGIVSCTQPLAAAAGHKILSQGGNAAVCILFNYIYRIQLY